MNSNQTFKREEMKPIIVDWQITPKCTRKCEFCYGSKREEELNTKDIFYIIDILNDIGVKVIDITGGEPLIRKDIAKIIKYIKSKNIAVCLSTNCDRYKENRNTILEYVDALGIPIEGSNKSIHDRLRGYGNFKSIMFSLNDAFSNSNIKFRINTVITNQNYFDLGNIEMVLDAFKEKVVYWKLYELIIYPPKRQNTNLIVRDGKGVKNHLNKLGRFLGTDKIVFDTLETRNRGYFLIKPNGAVFIPILNKIPPEEYIIGNILIDPEKVITNWKKNVDFESYAKPYRSIFRKDNELKCKFLTGGEIKC